MFAVFIHHRERQLVVCTLSEKWVNAEIVQRVVHPAHVPLECETETAVGNRMRDAWPRGALFGNHRDAAM